MSTIRPTLNTTTNASIGVSARASQPVRLPGSKVQAVFSRNQVERNEASAAVSQLPVRQPVMRRQVGMLSPTPRTACSKCPSGVSKSPVPASPFTARQRSAYKTPTPHQEEGSWLQRGLLGLGLAVAAVAAGAILKRVIVGHTPPMPGTMGLYVPLACNKDCGLFSVFTSVLGALKLKEAGVYSGIHLDFGTNGLYYDPAKGGNFWEYYMKPITVADPKKCMQGTTCMPQDINGYVKMAYDAEGSLSRKEAHALIKKYFQVRPEIQQIVDDFVKEHFVGQGRIIGLHYRGTDKATEAKQLDYEEVFARLERLIFEKHDMSKVKIFVASDEEAFIQACKERFPGLVIASNARRSLDGKPLHFNSDQPYETGLQALVDALLLSKTDVLLRTSSNLSLWSSYFNPNIPVFSLTERKSGTPIDQITSKIFLKAAAPDGFRKGRQCTHGMFAVTSCMLGLLREYEGKQYGGIQIDFGDGGCYYDPAYPHTENKQNWWNYYFEPVNQNNQNFFSNLFQSNSADSADPLAGYQVRTFSGAEYGDVCFAGEFLLSREEANRLIQKHIKIRPEIQKKVDAFVAKHFSGKRVITVHYRGTDKDSEASRVEYQTVLDEMKKYIQENKLAGKEFVFFVASDEDGFINEAEGAFPGHVVSTEALRSQNGNPIHLSRETGEQSPGIRGEQGLIDALLVGAKEAEACIRTNSNLSLFSTYWNPKMKEILLNRRRA